MRMTPLARTTLVALSACATVPPSAPTETEHHHELHLPPVGPKVRVTLDGNSTDVVLASLPHERTSARLAALWAAAWPAAEAAPLHFDLTGSDGFHPASRTPCTRWLTGAEIAAARIDIVTHDISFDEPLALPGCYRVKAVVAMEGAR